MSRIQPSIAILLPVFLAGAITLVTGLTYGRLTNRWGAPVDVDAIAARVESVPKTVGPWECTQEIEVPGGVRAILEAFAMSHRTYKHNETGEEIGMFIVIGPPGPVSVHTPEICFPSSSYSIESDRRLVTLSESGAGDSFWAVDFRGTDVHGSKVRAYYAWTQAAVWSASMNPRWEFAGKPYLIKVQAVTPLPRQEHTGQQDACARFFESFTPLFAQHMSHLTK